LVSRLVEVLLRIARTGRTRVKGSREVRVVAVAADDVGIEGNELVLADDVGGRLLEPGIRPLARAQQPGLAVVSVLLDDRLVENRPQLVFRHTGTYRVTKPANRNLGRAERGIDAFHLFGGLDRARHFNGPLSIDNPQSEIAQGDGRARIQALKP